MGKFHIKLQISSLAQKGRRWIHPKPVASSVAKQQCPLGGAGPLRLPRSLRAATVPTTPSCVMPGLSPPWCLCGACTLLFFHPWPIVPFLLVTSVTWCAWAHRKHVLFPLWCPLGYRPSMSSAYNSLVSNLIVYMKCSPLNAFKSFRKYLFFRDAFSDHHI